MARIDSGGCSVSADWLDYADPPLAPLRRTRTGSKTPISGWLQYADHEVAPLRRSVTPSALLRTPLPLCPASVLWRSWCPPLALLPSHRDDRFSCSSSKPDPRSRRLYAGCQLGTAQVTPQPRPRAITPPGFDTALVISTRHRTVHFRSTPRITPDAVKLRLFHRRSSPGLLTPATRGGLMPAPACRHRGALPHLR